jgi:hypothetical protein
VNATTKRVFGIALLTVALCWATVRTADNPAGTGLTAETRREVIDAISRTLVDGYVYEDIAKKMAAALREHREAGRYDDLKSSAEFAARLTEDLQKVNKDRHLGVRFDTPRPAGAKAPAAKQRGRP